MEIGELEGKSGKQKSEKIRREELELGIGTGSKPHRRGTKILAWVPTRNYVGSRTFILIQHQIESHLENSVDRQAHLSIRTGTANFFSTFFPSFLPSILESYLSDSTFSKGLSIQSHLSQQLQAHKSASHDFFHQSHFFLPLQPATFLSRSLLLNLRCKTFLFHRSDSSIQVSLPPNQISLPLYHFTIPFLPLCPTSFQFTYLPIFHANFLSFGEYLFELRKIGS